MANKSTRATMKALGKALDAGPGFVPAIYREIGGRVAFLREAKGMTQEKLAKKVGLSRTSVCNFESGKQACPLAIILDLANALDVRPSVIFKGLWQ